MYGYGTGSVIVDGVSCRGNETHLSSCRYTTSTSIGHQNDVGIRCYGMAAANGEALLDLHTVIKYTQ